MSVGEFYTFTVWELKTGHKGQELEDLTRVGIIPQYGRIEGVRRIMLFRIDEGQDVGKYVAVTVYESRDAYNKWFTSNGREIQEWQNALRPVLERWVESANQSSVQRSTLMIDHEFPRADEPPPPPPPSSGMPRIIF